MDAVAYFLNLPASYHPAEMPALCLTGPATFC